MGSEMCIRDRDEIDHAQPEYWEKRLGRQAQLSIMSGKIGWADLDALRQIDKLDDLINEQHRIGAELAERELVEQGRTEISSSNTEV